MFTNDSHAHAQEASGSALARDAANKPTLVAKAGGDGGGGWGVGLGEHEVGDKATTDRACRDSLISCARIRDSLGCFARCFARI